MYKIFSSSFFCMTEASDVPGGDKKPAFDSKSDNSEKPEDDEIRPIDLPPIDLLGDETGDRDDSVESNLIWSFCDFLGCSRNFLIGVVKLAFEDWRLVFIFIV